MHYYGVMGADQLSVDLNFDGLMIETHIDPKTHLKTLNILQPFGFQDQTLKVNWMEVLERMGHGLVKTL